MVRHRKSGGRSPLGRDADPAHRDIEAARAKILHQCGPGRPHEAGLRLQDFASSTRLQRLPPVSLRASLLNGA